MYNPIQELSTDNLTHNPKAQALMVDLIFTIKYLSVSLLELGPLSFNNTPTWFSPNYPEKDDEFLSM